MTTNTTNLAEARRATNLRVLHRLDPGIVDLAITATHVVLYEFNLSTQQWMKKNVEGSLFVVKRNDVPRFKLIICNRNSTENLEVGITSTFQMQLREPYLIFRDSSSSSSSGGGGAAASVVDEAIRGLWFHDGKEREQVHSYLENVVKSLQKIEEMERLHNDNGPSALLVNSNKGPAAVVEVNTNAAGAALLSALHLNDNTTTTEAAAAVDTKSRMQQHHQPTAIQSNNATKPSSSSNLPPPPPQSKTPTSSNINNNTTLDKKSLQLALLSLIQDERFLDLIHAQYLKVASSRARREQQQHQNNTNNND